MIRVLPLRSLTRRSQSATPEHLNKEDPLSIGTNTHIQFLAISSLGALSNTVSDTISAWHTPTETFIEDTGEDIQLRPFGLREPTHAFEECEGED